MRQFIELLAILWMFGLVTVLNAIWWFAFFDDGTTTVHIDLYGEMWPEFFAWMIVTAVLVVGLHNYLKTFEA